MRTEKEGTSFLLRDPRFQLIDLITKRRILELAVLSVNTDDTAGESLGDWGLRGTVNPG
jgi:hypothetical protein